MGLEADENDSLPKRTNEDKKPVAAVPSAHGTACWIVVSIVAVVSVVIVNKRIYTVHKFLFGNTLCALHIGSTGLMIWLFELFGLFKRKEMPIRSVVQLSIANVFSLMFINLSLLYNSIGMYQVLKLANIPVLCVIEYFWLGKTYSNQVKMSLAVLLVGIGVCTATEVHFSGVGFFFGCIATVFTCWYQISIGTEQKKNDVNGLQALMWQAPTMFLMFLPLVPATDDISALLQYQFTNGALFEIGLSCCIALLINISAFFLIGRSSPLTYQVVGHLKTSLVFVFGWTIIKEPIIAKNVLGIMVAFVGMAWYTHIQNTPKLPLASVLLSQRPEKHDEDGHDTDDVEEAPSTPHTPSSTKPTGSVLGPSA